MKKLFAIGALILVLTGCETVPESPIPAGGSIRSTFLCEGGQPMTVDFADGLALLKASNVSVQLAQQPTGSGVHYTGGGYDLRGKGPDMTWTDPAGTPHQCRDVLATTTSETQASQPASLLGGTSWRLVHFQSSDDAVGTIVPPNVANYTLQFSNDGTLAMRLDCNRANARWEARPSSTANGSLTISPGAMTRAMCISGAMDTRLAQDVVRVRSYTLRDGQLSLSLEADGGTYLWEPIA